MQQLFRPAMTIAVVADGMIDDRQYQNLGTYQHSFGGRQVEVDLRNSIFVTLGLGYSF